MSRYKLTLRCNNFRHGPHKYSRTVDVDEDAGETLDDVPNPPCPLCNKYVKLRDEEVMATAPIPIAPIEQWLSQQEAPGIVGRSNTVKAIDMAAEISMKDYWLTDLKDNVRQGETMAPNLPPAQQKMADNFFSPQSNPAFASKRQKQIKLLGQRAIAGAFRTTALDVKSVLPDNRVALRPVRTEIVNKHR
jgi:hypothetical protein